MPESGEDKPPSDIEIGDLVVDQNDSLSRIGTVIGVGIHNAIVRYDEPIPLHRIAKKGHGQIDD